MADYGSILALGTENQFAQDPDGREKWKEGDCGVTRFHEGCFLFLSGTSAPVALQREKGRVKEIRRD